MGSHHKQSPTAKHTWEAHSTCTADLGVPDRRQYRRTPTGGVVIEMKEYFYTAPTGETLSHFTIVYVPPDRAAKYRDSDHHWINECVAVGDRILMLFEANRDEVLVVDLRPPDTQPSRTILNT